MKNSRTTFVGIVLLATIFFGLFLVLLGKARLPEVGMYLLPVFSILSAIGFLAAKDSNHE